MKKISTALERQTKNIQDQKLTIGLDLGDRSSWYCVLDGAGEVLLEQKLSTTPKAMKEVFRGMPRSRMALETGIHSPWVSRVLSELGHEVISRLRSPSSRAHAGCAPFASIPVYSLHNEFCRPPTSPMQDWECRATSVLTKLCSAWGRAYFSLGI